MSCCRSRGLRGKADQLSNVGRQNAVKVTSDLSSLSQPLRACTGDLRKGLVPETRPCEENTSSVHIRELKHQTFLVSPTPTGSIFAAWQPLRMSRRSWAAVTDFKTRVLRLKPEVQILGSSKNIRHTKVEILHLKSCFLRSNETKLNANLWKAFSTELSHCLKGLYTNMKNV